MPWVNHYCIKNGCDCLGYESEIVIFQESSEGSWHVPIAGEISDESLRTWLCVARSGPSAAVPNTYTNVEASEVCELNCDNQLSNLSGLETLADRRNSDGNSDEKSISVTGKRKERSPSNIES